MRARRKPVFIFIILLAIVPFVMLMLDMFSAKSSAIKGGRSVGQKRILPLHDNVAIIMRKPVPTNKSRTSSKASIEIVREEVKTEPPKLPKHKQESIKDTCKTEHKCHPTKSGMLNVHFVPHSHMDVGWKKTMEQYYLGVGGGNVKSYYYGQECSSCVLDNVIVQLTKDPTRRFMVSEMAFFSRWYSEQNMVVQDAVRGFVKSGRLELVGGGWCVSDSANTYYDDIIDQHTYGNQWIENEFGECAMSNIGWHIDQFGHSREHSSIFAQMGFDAIFLGRIDFQDQERRTNTRNMETIWTSSPFSLGNRSSLFASVLYDGYFTPAGLGWEGRNPESRKDLQDYETKKLIKTALQWAKSYKTKNILIPFGGDFAFNTAAFWYEGLDDLIMNVNDQQQNGSLINALYSTPRCYINSVNKEGAMFETMTTDFFPYATIPNTFWTGFYTSRPGLKRHVKVASSLLQTCRELTVLARLTQVSEDIAVLKEAVAILQHHDAITGTEMQHVTDDYNHMLSEGELSCQGVISIAYKSLLPVTEQEMFPSQHFCDSLNISVCHVMETSKQVLVTLFNPLAQHVTHWVRLPTVASPHLVLSQDIPITTQLLPISDATLRIPERGTATISMELVFRAELPPLGFAIYNININRETNNEPPIADIGKTAYSIANKFLSLTLDPVTGVTKTLNNLVTGVNIQLEQTYLYYIASEGQERDPDDHTGGFLGSHKRPSGAYVFSPKENTKPLILKGSRSEGVKVKTFKGVHVQEIHQQFSPWVSQVIRLYDDAPYLELEWTVGPIPQGKNESKDVLSRFTTDLKTDAVLYTDSNGRENMLRRRNTRETWNLTVTNPITGNFYPVTARMFLRDRRKNVQLTVLTDRSQGGASLKDGQMEIMVHRRTFKDDDMGVNEPLNERGVDGRGLIARGTHYLFLETIDRSPSHYRPLGLRVHHPPTISFMLPNGITGNLFTSFSGLRDTLPHNVHLLTLDQTPGDPDTLLLRLENYYEKGEAPAGVREEAIVKLQHMFINFDITTVRELSLGANHNITRVRRLQWKASDGSISPSKMGSDDARDVHSPPFLIRLRPMEIRTFHVTTGPPPPPPQHRRHGL